MKTRFNTPERAFVVLLAWEKRSASIKRHGDCYLAGIARGLMMSLRHWPKASSNGQQ